MVKSSKGGKGQKKPENGSSGFFGNLWTHQILPLLGSARTYIVTGILAVAVWGWHELNGLIQKYVAASISAELEDEKSLLYTNVSKAIDKMRKLDVGEITTGTFILNNDNPTYPLIVYVPADKNYTAQMLYHVDAPFPACQKVDVVAPEARKTSTLRLDDHFLDLEMVDKSGSSQTPDTEEDASPHQANLRNNLKVFTFQLHPQGAADLSDAQVRDVCSKVSPRLTINFATLVAPTIHMGQ
jgi:hypothetical protein